MAERKRERVITKDEEKLLLAACDAPKCKHLRAIIICALDTGTRQGEMLKLRWRDVDFDNGIITVAAFNTKTMRERTLSMKVRLSGELEKLYGQSPKHPDGGYASGSSEPTSDGKPPAGSCAGARSG